MNTLTSKTKQFLKAIFGGHAAEATVEWWKFDATGKAVGRRAARARDANPAADDAIYWSVGLMKPGTGRANANVLSVHALVADDVGTKVDRDMVDLFMPAPTEIVESSQGNFQYVWAVPEGMSVGQHAELWAAMEAVLGVKLDGSDHSHLFRLPQGVNGKPGKQHMAVKWGDINGAVYSYASLRAILPRAPGLQGSSLHGAKGTGRPNSAIGSPPQQAPSVEAVKKLLDGPLRNTWDGTENSGLREWWENIVKAIRGSLQDFPEEARKLAEEWSGPHEPDFDRVWESQHNVHSAGWGALEIAAKERAGVVLATEAFDDGASPPPAGAVVSPLDAEQRRIAAHIVRTLGHEMRWNVSQKKWMLFSGDVWAVVDYDAGFWAAAQWAAGVRAKSAQTAGFAEGVSKHLRNTPSMLVTDGDFNRGPWLAGVPGGTLNLASGAMRPARASDMISKQLACAPDAGMACPLWLKFLTEACSGEAGMMDFLQRWAGYCLTGDVRQHKFVYLWGPGGNGKSLFVETLKRLMGSYGVQAASDLFVKKTQKGHPDALARLAGARLVVVPEISGGEKWDVDLLKEVTGNELMVARYMYGANFTFPVTFKIMSTGNHQPQFPGGINPAIERRFIYGKFENKPRVMDMGLADKFVPEMPGIVAWALEGLTKGFASRKLDVPKSMADAAQEYFDESDPVLRWRKECMTQEAGAKVTVEEMFKNWLSWALANNVREWSSIVHFSRMLRHKGLFKIVPVRGKPTVSDWKLKEISPF